MGHLKRLGYKKDNPVVLTACHCLHDVCAQGGKPEEVFAEAVRKLESMCADGRDVLYRRARRETRVARNLPCPCGSGLKYKNCCIWKENVPDRLGESKLSKRVRDAFISLFSLMSAEGKKTDDKPN